MHVLRAQQDQGDPQQHDDHCQCLHFVFSAQLWPQLSRREAAEVRGSHPTDSLMAVYLKDSLEECAHLVPPMLMYLSRLCRRAAVPREYGQTFTVAVTPEELAIVIKLVETAKEVGWSDIDARCTPVFQTADPRFERPVDEVLATAWPETPAFFLLKHVPDHATLTGMRSWREHHGVSWPCVPSDREYECCHESLAPLIEATREHDGDLGYREASPYECVLSNEWYIQTLRRKGVDTATILRAMT